MRTVNLKDNNREPISIYEIMTLGFSVGLGVSAIFSYYDYQSMTLASVISTGIYLSILQGIIYHRS